MSEQPLEYFKHVVETAIEHGVWKWDDPNNVTDQLIIDTAEMLIDVSQQAEKKATVNEPVLEILFAAGIVPTSVPTLEAYQNRFADRPAPEFSKDGTDLVIDRIDEQLQKPPQGAFAQTTSEDISSMAKAAAAPLTEFQSPASSEPAHSPAPVAESIEDIYPGYDDQKVADIKKAIIHFAASGDLTPEEFERIKAYEEATEGRKTILSLKPEFKQPEPTPSERFEPGMPLQDSTPDPHNAPNGASNLPGAHEAGVQQMGGGGAPSENGDSIGAFYNGESISRAQQEGLPIPPQTTGEGVVMPIDITGTSDQELSRLATSYHSLFARTEWLISQESGRERAAEHLEHEAHRDAYIRAYELHKNAIPEEKRGPTALDGARKLADRDADDAQSVRRFRSAKVRHAIDVNELKALAKGYDRAVWRVTDELSRRSRLATTAHVPQR